ncbi:MAG: hypothetical protein PHR48_03595 [Candidatus ainarchaeum sp.]|nr:hypothetical protein [Candidatus ainarchaeum sp.]
MNKLKVELENCYGIKKLNYEFDFSNCNTYVIYAPNGAMKTSFAKVFLHFQEGKENLIRDEIFNNQPVIKNIQLDNFNIQSKEIFVIKSFDNFYESKNMANLLINDSLKIKLSHIFNKRDSFFNSLEKKSGLKISKTLNEKNISELESVLLFDFNITSFLQNLNLFHFEDVQYYYDIKYSQIFDPTILKIVQLPEFQNNIRLFLNKSDEIYNNFSFLEKGKFSLGKLKNVSKKLKENNFFVRNNKIILDGIENQISNVNDLDSKIKIIEDKLKESKEFQSIEKHLSIAKGIILKDILEIYPELIEKLKIENIAEFKKELWLSYFKQNEDMFNELKEDFNSFLVEKEITSFDNTPWKKAYKIFKNRFKMPFEMDIQNVKSSILGESLPKVIFKFYNKKTNKWVEHSREKIEGELLSQGEKRALFLLNIIFDIEDRKKRNQKTLFIIDDIADSFDYKNKYAIVEYLKAISDDPNNRQIILTHNFDFYRTISSRLNIIRDNRLHILFSENKLDLIEEHYQNQPFAFWKNNLGNNKFTIALIPFVRNLIEYSYDKKINTIGIPDDFNFMTNLLHIKDKTKEITVKELKELFLGYLGKNNLNYQLSDTDKIYDLIFNIVNKDISNNDCNLEDKIIFAIAIRLKAEEYMWSKVSDKTEILKHLTRTLFERYKNEFKNDSNYDLKIKTLESVNIMTPENIHLNSFMYEPILDMGIDELKNLYEEVCKLLEGEKSELDDGKIIKN